MPRDLACLKQELEEAVARIPGTPANPLEEYYRYEETAASINDAIAYQEPGFSKPDQVEVLELYLLKLCEIRALELGVVLDFEG
jgi:hypothetical protein